MNLGSRRVRLKGVWLLLVPFVLLSRPTPEVLVSGAALAVAGAAIRGWAAGCIRKEDALATRGPYAHTRNPLYLGSLLLGTGVAVAGGRWIFVLLFLAFFFLVYPRTMRHEERVLQERFGEAYRRYRRSVPLLIPRVSPYRADAVEDGGDASRPGAEDGRREGSGPFSARRYLRNREWEAALGLAAGFAFLWVKMVWIG